MNEIISPGKLGTMTQEKIESGSATDEPRWLKHERSLAWELYSKTEMPTSRDEDWRRTEIDTLNLASLRDPADHLEEGDRADLPQWFLEGLDHFGSISGAVAIAGSKLWLKPVSEELIRRGVVFCDLRTACAKYGDLVRQYFASDSPRYSSASLQSKFALLNRAMFNYGVFLYIPENVVVEEPFVGFVSESTATGFTSLPRVFIVAAPHSKAQYIQAFLSDSKDGQSDAGSWSLSDSLVEIYVGEEAALDYVEVQSFDRRTFAVGETHSAIASNGKFSSLTVALGGGQVKSDIITSLNDRGAVSKILGVTLGDRSERFSFNTVQEHHAPDGTSDINFRVALKDSASSINQGSIRVAKVAQRTDAFQSNKNLLLGAEAKADSIPRLEILADDVKCSHGATVGPVDKEQIFYLMSRGLDPNQAEELVVTGFFRKVIEACPVHGVSDWIGSLVGEKISGSKKSK
jgi:Fe-S cluster assembly protein SufD